MSEITDNEHNIEESSLWNESYKPIPCSDMQSCGHIEVPRKLENVGGKISWIKHPAIIGDKAGIEKLIPVEGEDNHFIVAGISKPGKRILD
jgi:hypothetical protein